jgi:hypothetical protein
MPQALIGLAHAHEGLCTMKGLQKAVAHVLGGHTLTEQYNDVHALCRLLYRDHLRLQYSKKHSFITIS